MDLSMACVIHGCFLCLYLFGFYICSGMCLSSRLINLLINKVYASFGHSLFTKSSHFVVNRELLKLSIFELLKFLRFISLCVYLWSSEFLLMKMKLG